jgi:hypothetical protein
VSECDREDSAMRKSCRTRGCREGWGESVLIFFMVVVVIMMMKKIKKIEEKDGGNQFPRGCC